jgi:hypothetical protein
VPRVFLESLGVDDLPINPNRVSFFQNVTNMTVNGRVIEHFSKVFIIHSLPDSTGEIPCFTIFSECFIKISPDLNWNSELLSFRDL